MLTPLNDLLPQEYFDYQFHTDRAVHTEILTMDNNIYTFGHRYGLNFIPMGINYNETMLQREGLPDIYDLWKAGKWT